MDGEWCNGQWCLVKDNKMPMDVWNKHICFSSVFVSKFCLNSAMNHSYLSPTIRRESGSMFKDCCFVLHEICISNQLSMMWGTLCGGVLWLQIDFLDFHNTIFKSIHAWLWYACKIKNQWQMFPHISTLYPDIIPILTPSVSQKKFYIVAYLTLG